MSDSISISLPPDLAELVAQNRALLSLLEPLRTLLEMQRQPVSAQIQEFTSELQGVRWALEHMTSRLETLVPAATVLQQMEADLSSLRTEQVMTKELVGRLIGWLSESLGETAAADHD